MILVELDQELVDAWNSGEHGSVEMGAFWPAKVGEWYPAVVQKVWENGMVAAKVWPIGSGAMQVMLDQPAKEENYKWKPVE